MIVLKFGGTSVGSPTGRTNICALARQFAAGDGEAASGQVVVVVSALGGVTDMLLSVGGEAAVGMDYEPGIAKLRHRHAEAIELSIAPNKQESLQAQCTKLLDEVARLVQGISLLRELSPRIQRTLVAYGERLSSLIMAAMIEESAHLDTTTVVKTTSYFQRHIVDFPLTNSSLRCYFESQRAPIIVMGGFIATDSSNGEVTNLGRGGSDYTAAIVAAALKAEELYIYTDVDGFLSADPRVVPEAVLLDNLSFTEAMELCNFGAKVLYAPTLWPAYNASTPIIIRSTLNPTCGGTTIANSTGNGYRGAVGISTINDAALLTMRAAEISAQDGMGLIGANYRLFKTLARAGIAPLMVSEDVEQNSTSVTIRNGEVEGALRALRDEFAREIAQGEIEEPSARKNLATIAVVGEALSQNEELASQLYALLRARNIPIIATRAASETQSLTFMSELWALRDATKTLHKKLFEKQHDTLCVYVASEGEVARALIEQIQSTRHKIAERLGLNIQIARSEEELIKAQNRVYVECGDSSSSYSRMLEMGISVVTCSLSGYENFAQWQSLAKEHGSNFLYGASIGEGMPLLATIKSMVSSGDTITRIEAKFTEHTHQTMYLLAQECGYALTKHDDTTPDNHTAQDCVSTLFLNNEAHSCTFGTMSAEGTPFEGLAQQCSSVLIYSNKYREYPLQLRTYAAPTTQDTTANILSDILHIVGK